MEPYIKICTTDHTMELEDTREQNKMKESFYGKLEERRKAASKNSVFLTKDSYAKICGEVEAAKVKAKKEPRDYWLLKKYGILSTQNSNKLVVPLKEGSEHILYYVHDDELFDILFSTHFLTGHGGRDRMIREVSAKYKNITRSDVELFLHLCEPCQKKGRGPKKGAVVQPLIFAEFNARCLLDFIDYQTFPDGEHKFVMVYQDYRTKFLVLRALRTRAADEVVQQLLDVFTTFGAPAALQCDLGKQCVRQMLDSLTPFWPHLRIVPGDPKAGIERTTQDVEHMVFAWMQENDAHWARGIKFVQLRKNNAHHAAINSTPYEALFGRKMHGGLGATDALSSGGPAEDCLGPDSVHEVIACEINEHLDTDG